MPCPYNFLEKGAKPLSILLFTFIQQALKKPGFGPKPGFLTYSSGSIPAADTFNSEFLIQSETIQIWQSYCKDWWYPTKLLS